MGLWAQYSGNSTQWNKPGNKKKKKIWIFVYCENLGYLGKYRKGIMKKSLKMAKLWQFKKLWCCVNYYFFAFFLHFYLHLKILIL